MKLAWLRNQNPRLKMVLAYILLSPFLIILSPFFIVVCTGYFLLQLFGWAVDEITGNNFRDDK